MAKVVQFFRQITSRNKHYTQLIEPHLAAMYRMAYRWTQNRDDAEDILQDVLAKLVNKTSEMEKVEKLRPWLIKIAYRCFVDNYRKQLGKEEMPETDWRADTSLIDDLASQVQENSDEYRRLELQRELLVGLQGLNEDQRNVVLMHDVEGYTAEEVATILDISIGTVKSRLHRAREILKKILTDGTI